MTFHEFLHNLYFSHDFPFFLWPREPYTRCLIWIKIRDLLTGTMREIWAWKASGLWLFRRQLRKASASIFMLELLFLSLMDKKSNLREKGDLLFLTIPGLVMFYKILATLRFIFFSFIILLLLDHTILLIILHLVNLFLRFKLLKYMTRLNFISMTYIQQ